MTTQRSDASPRRRILVVDDNEWNVKLVKTVLSARGHDVAGAGTAAQALALVASFRPCLILMDLELPDTDGLTLSRQLKAGPDTRGIPIVALTAHASDEVEAAVRAAGCDGLITKPIEPVAFWSSVSRYLPETGKDKLGAPHGP